MSSVDYTPFILAQVTDLQMRVTKQDALISTLKAEVERLSGHSIMTSEMNTMRTSVPLMPLTAPMGQKFTKPSPPLPPRHERPNERPNARAKPKIASQQYSTNPHPEFTIQDVLKSGEEVTLQINTGKDSSGNFTTTNAIATFDGINLEVTKCEMAPSLVGMQTTKPGEILYKFIDELKNSGHIKKTFSIAPWKLCFVERDGVKRSLEQLRTIVG
jgi:hypothetical protein